MMEPEPAFVLGTMFGALLLWFFQSLVGSYRRRKEAGERIAAAAVNDKGRLREIEDLHERLAVLERIATEPGSRTAAEIERLR
jgi:hypothetical protein